MHLWIDIVCFQAALRKVYSLHQSEELNNNEQLKRLVEPKLMESFLMCSGQKENFV